MTLWRRPLAKTLQQQKGLEGEDRALAYLQQQGLHLLARNWRCKAGEIDLVMQDHDTLVFVEVRLRRDARYGDAAASVTRHKQQKLVRAAQYYLQQHPVDRPCRFDVVALMEAAATLDWQKNAFEASGDS